LNVTGISFNCGYTFDTLKDNLPRALICAVTNYPAVGTPNVTDGWNAYREGMGTTDAQKQVMKFQLEKNINQTDVFRRTSLRLLMDNRLAQQPILKS
jgi:hypothetical protein